MANGHQILPFGPYLRDSAYPTWLATVAGELLCSNLAFENLMGLETQLGEFDDLQIAVVQTDGALDDLRRRFLENPAPNRNITLCFQGKAGLEHRCDCICRAVMSNGQLVGIFGRIRIQDSPRALGALDENLPDEQMRHHRNILQMVTETAGVAAWYSDPDTGQMFATDNYFEMLGYRPGAIALDSTWVRAQIHPDDLPEATRQIEDMIAGKRDVYRVDYRLRCKDGAWKWCQATGFLKPLDHLTSSPIIYGSVMDISVRKADEERLENALRESEATKALIAYKEETHRVATQSGGIAPWHIDPITRDAWWSDAFYALLGYDHDELAGTSAAFRALIHPDDASVAVTSMNELIAGDADVYHTDFRLKTRDGSWVWCESTARLVSREAIGLHPLICGSMRNITTRKAFEQQLEAALHEAEQARDDALAARVLAQGNEDMLRASAVSGAIGPWNVCPATGDCWMMDVTYRMFGYRPGEFVPDDIGWRSLFHPDDLAGGVAAMEDLVCDRAEVYDYAHRLRHKDGTYHWYRGIARKIDRSAQDLPFLIAGATTPIGHLKENEARLAEAAAAANQISDRLTSIADNAPAGLYEFRWHPNSEPDFPYTSACFGDLLGYTRDEIETLKVGIFARVHPDDLAELMASMQASTSSLTQWNHRFRWEHPTRGLIWLAGSATPKRHIDGTVISAGAIYDVTNDVHREAELRQAHHEAEQMRAENEKQALHDVLTRLPNRRYFDQHLEDRLAAAKLGEGPKDCVLIRVDVDRFKYVNDTMGHEAGDQVLIRIADIFRESVRGSDFSARVGGDEFSIVLSPGSLDRQAKCLVDRIQALMAIPLTFNGRQCHLHASFGVAYVADITAPGIEIQSFADTALYRAKEKGRNRMEFFTSDMHRDFIDGQSLASELHDALKNKEFVPFFQPQISAKDGSVIGVETLVRWQHPKKGLLTPNKFLKTAEQLKVVADIDRMMVEKSTESLARLRKKGVFVPKISFNVSSGRMQDPEIIAEAQQISKGETRVTFELIESILVEEESVEFKRHLSRIRDAGIDIEIDDFGSGHASIIGLMEVLPTALKIDQRIVSHVAEKEASAKLVKAIIQIAGALGIRIVAEGVEMQAQADTLRKLGCDVFQGHLFAKPLSEADLEIFLKSG
ncbi:PAS domain-containing protein [Yoonia sp.]|uniref:sensor domain-containing protein n=1 Tax=Yoonia sp. TaxID=2212373 RepID=UPI0025F641B9|nr:PAS domain-containing protein [Yoonia sp.]